ncbi:MAG: WbqC family protein [Chitinophagales bacterium]|nr:WbqC family protein [Chitinophagales bacterium]
MSEVFPLYYFGNIAYWKTILSENEIVLSTKQVIPKKSYANRTIILMANGLQTMSVPLIGGRGSKVPFDEIEISYGENWISKHKMTLQSAYSKSPFYEFYMPYFESILNSKPIKLLDLNKKIFLEIIRILKLQNIVMESEFISTIKFTPNEFETQLSVYPQVFRYKYAFQPDLSILDLLFCLGPNSKDYLSQ